GCDACCHQLRYNKGIADEHGHIEISWFFLEFNPAMWTVCMHLFGAQAEQRPFEHVAFATARAFSRYCALESCGDVIFFDCRCVTIFYFLHVIFFLNSSGVCPSIFLKNLLK